MGDLRPVIVAFPLGGVVPWEVGGVPDYSNIALDADTSLLDTAQVVAVFAKYRQIELDQPAKSVLSELVEKGIVAAPGGIEFVGDDGQSLDIGCCCGLETWREWLQFENGMGSPWLGHDPSPWIEAVGDRVIGWKDAEAPDGSKEFTEMSRSEFSEKLAQIEPRLLAFRKVLAEWLHSQDPDTAESLVKQFEANFIFAPPR